MKFNFDSCIFQINLYLIDFTLVSASVSTALQLKNANKRSGHFNYTSIRHNKANTRHPSNIISNECSRSTGENYELFESFIHSQCNIESFSILPNHQMFRSVEFPTSFQFEMSEDENPHVCFN